MFAVELPYLYHLCMYYIPENLDHIQLHMCSMHIDLYVYIYIYICMYKQRNSSPQFLRWTLRLHSRPYLGSPSTSAAHAPPPLTPLPTTIRSQVPGLGPNIIIDYFLDNGDLGCIKPTHYAEWREYHGTEPTVGIPFGSQTWLGNPRTQRVFQ